MWRNKTIAGSYLGLADGEWKAVSITICYHLSTDISIRQHFQVTCDTWKMFQVKHLSENVLFWVEYHHTQISQRNATCAYMRNWKYLSKPEGALEQKIWTPL